MERMDQDEPVKPHCIRGKHVAFICLAVVASAVAVGLGVGLSRPPCSVVDPSAEPPEPTAGPVPPPVQRGPCTPSNDSTGGWGDFRLPDYVKPVHYDLHLLPDLITDVYQGSVAIHLEVSRPTRHLWLHIRETFVTAVPRLQLVTQWRPQRSCPPLVQGRCTSLAWTFVDGSMGRWLGSTGSSIQKMGLSSEFIDIHLTTQHNRLKVIKVVSDMLQKYRNMVILHTW